MYLLQSVVLCLKICQTSLLCRSALELDCKAVSKKVRQAHLGLTMESEYIKEGSATYVWSACTYLCVCSVIYDYVCVVFVFACIT